MNDFALLRARVAEVLEISEEGILPETALAELANWDSVNALRLLNNIEGAFRIRLRYVHFSEARTAGDLHGLVKEARSDVHAG
jgi:acyl carrier protein